MENTSLVCVCQYICIDKPTFEQLSMLKSQGNHILKGATIKGKNMLPIGGIFFPLRVAPMRIENNLKGQ